MDMELFGKCWSLAMMMIIWPFILAITVIILMADNIELKCKYDKICPRYSKDSVTCTKNGGDYYVGIETKMASCYERMEEKYGNDIR